MTLTKTKTNKGQPSMLVLNQHRWLSFSLISPLVPKINAKAKRGLEVINQHIVLIFISFAILIISNKLRLTLSLSLNIFDNSFFYSVFFLLIF